MIDANTWERHQYMGGIISLRTEYSCSQAHTNDKETASAYVIGKPCYRARLDQLLRRQLSLVVKKRKLFCPFRGQKSTKIPSPSGSNNTSTTSPLQFHIVGNAKWPIESKPKGSAYGYFSRAFEAKLSKGTPPSPNSNQPINRRDLSIDTTSPLHPSPP